MVIMKDLPGLEVSIAVDHIGSYEYKYEEDDEISEYEPTQVDRYIEAFSGARFAVIIRFDQPNFPFALADMVIKVYVDGIPMIRRVSEMYQRNRNEFMSMDYVAERTEQGWVKRYLHFSELHIHEGDADKSLLGRLDRLGTIAVTFQRIEFEYYSNPSRRHGGGGRYSLPLLQPRLPDDSISEKNLKGSGVSHQARLVPTVTILTAPQPLIRRGPDPARYNRSIIPLDRNKPFATFVFKYRSRAALQALLLIPRSPSPVPLEDRPVETLTPEELHQLVKRRHERMEHEALVQRIKKEHEEWNQAEDSAVEEEDDIEMVEDRPAKRMKLVHANDDIYDDVADRIADDLYD